ncbi:MAG: ribbon-helix-helix protein, CopG family [Deltaproteobacteria bacterium]|nr:ribbon-helix-helix protein, CopG family [Deltaproteobacteria bacterium]
MKLLSIRVDDYLLNLIDKEAKSKKSTKVEIIRAAIINYFISKKDIQDIQLAESRLDEENSDFNDSF